MFNYLVKLLMVIGCIISLNASWLPVKAWISQQLISHSWHHSKHQQLATKPWPWADTFPVAELSFKRLNESIVVLNGGDPTTLAFSAGAIAPFNQTSANNPFIVAGHKDSHFSFLEHIIMKDIISLTDKYGHGQLYQVEAIDIVTATQPLPITAGDTSLILITCYPFNNSSSDNNERYIITARKL